MTLGFEQEMVIKFSLFEENSYKGEYLCIFYYTKLDG